MKKKTNIIDLCATAATPTRYRDYCWTRDVLFTDSTCVKELDDTDVHTLRTKQYIHSYPYFRYSPSRIGPN